MKTIEIKTMPGNKVAGQGNGIVAEVESVAQILSAIGRHPVVIFKGGTSLQTLEEIAALFGGAKENPTFADIRDIRIDPSAKNGSIALSAEAHPPHTDGTFSPNQLTVFMLQCVVPDELGGGNGLYWGVEDMLANMPRRFLDVLMNQPIDYSRLREDGVNTDRYCGPIIFYHQERLSIRWRFDAQVRPVPAMPLLAMDRELFDSAIAWVLNYLTTEPPVEIRYNEGDIVICNNLTALHGRRSLKGQQRHFRRAWLELI